MKRNSFLILILIIASCQKEKRDAIPAYIKIDSINLEETNITSNITDAWVYINDQLQGVYELPAEFPVLENDVQMLRIKAGIKSNGIASSRIAYPFYSSYFEEVIFNPESTIIINPTIGYLDSIEFFLEDFEGIGLNIATTIISDTSIIQVSSEENDYGVGVLNDSLFIFEIETDELSGLPQAGSPVFLELDYKSNTQFLVGAYINYPQSVIKKDLLWINPKEDWNKIYINLTSTISEGINASSFKVFIGMQRDFTLDANTIYLDNLKIIY